MTIVEMRVHMDCAGCESKIRKSLQNLRGVDEIDIDMAMQKVTVTGYADQKKVLKRVRKTGRRAELWGFPYNPEIQVHNQQHALYNHHQPLQTAAASSYHQYYPSNYNYAAPSSHYNYYKHGYDDTHRYAAPSHTNIVSDRAGAMFSDDNPNACSVM
ncbi:hypothetical protein H6P81_003778 [Aristolochia fimbriata]|uniref:HMA domain-containing protein n=1 Tax=Aristolochia fimbriata TaxID=158543 RepID=A0AAV7FDJ9_ARIFI|nr:hypothetical protein H6P81_003778 [Aristolochia fimbriata]